MLFRSALANLPASATAGPAANICAKACCTSAAVQAVQAADVQQAFAQMLAAGPAVALAGKFAKATDDHVRDILGQAGMRLA